MVHYYKIETGQYTHVVWNSDHSFYYQYRFKQPLTFKTNASEWIKGYKPEFKKWVESADTLNYGRYGRQASWFDAPLISFTVATKSKQHWNFISSRSFSINVDRLD
jgi:hypothetical protein